MGTGHAVRDTVEWLIPVLWPIDLINLPRRGPTPVLKPETRLTVKVLDDFGIPTKAEVQHQPELISRYNYADNQPAQQPAPEPVRQAYEPPLQQSGAATVLSADRTIVYDADLDCGRGAAAASGDVWISAAVPTPIPWRCLMAMGIRRRPHPRRTPTDIRRPRMRGITGLTRARIATSWPRERAVFDGALPDKSLAAEELQTVDRGQKAARVGRVRTVPAAALG